MRILVCGGRNYSNYTNVTAVLDEYLPRNPVIIHGGARGADTLAGLWAENNHRPVAVFMADWQKYGRGAGSLRNGKMLYEGKPDLVIAFPGGTGTADMVRRSKAAKVIVREIPE